ncbi:MAG TPA: hypothetical protein VGA85_05925 [Dehalococcoidales bacterium]
MINLIKSEIKLPLRAVFFIGIAIPLFFIDKLGILTALCFALASLILFCVFVIIPHNLEQEYTKLKAKHSPLRIYQMNYDDDKNKVDVEYAKQVNSWLEVAVFLLVLGIVVYIVVR